jgi:predicted dehydrogenase
MKLPGAEVAALCDVDAGALRSTAEAFDVPAAHTYRDAHRMLEEEDDLDVLFSVVRARHRTDVEIGAAERGLHLFSEKPQAETMVLALRIDDAVRRAGVLSTVGVRERYRPLFQRVRRHLADKEVVHVDFRSIHRYRPPRYPAGDAPPSSLPSTMLMSWGVHAVDYIRFLTGLDVDQVQAFQLLPEPHRLPLAHSVHAQLTNGAAVSITFARAAETPPRETPFFDVYYRGGVLSLARHGYSAWSLRIDDEVVVEDDDFDPWFAQDRAFIEAVRTGDPTLILNDYHDGLFSLAPVLAARASAQGEGQLITIQTFMDAAT